jgi:hypothetical protein
LAIGGISEVQLGEQRNTPQKLVGRQQLDVPARRA